MSNKNTLKLVLEKISNSTNLNMSDLSSQLGMSKESINSIIDILISIGCLQKNTIDSSNLCGEGCCTCSESTINAVNPKYTLSITEKGKNMLSS
jgi:hypothetical protein